MEKRVSSRDVAREAGVSRATVSYILNNVEGVKIRTETREKVLEAAKKLGYHPDSIARALKTNRSMSIGVVTRRDVSEERFTKILRGIKDVLSKHNYSIVLCSEEADSSGHPEYYKYFREKKVDGVLLISYIEALNKKDVNLNISLVEKDRIPAVFIDYHISNPMMNCVDMNYFHGAYIATRHLIDKGHRKLIHVVPDLDTIQENERLKGFIQAVREAGINEKDIMTITVKPSEESTRKIFEHIEVDLKQYTAMVFNWSNMAYTALCHANKKGIRIPQEIAVIALGVSSFADFSYPNLTTSELPLLEAGRKGAEVLMDMLANESLPVNVTLPCSLKIREST